MSALSSQKNFLNEFVIPDLEQDGYTVIVEYQSDLLPKEFRVIRPDAIAFGPNKKMIVEVRTGTDLPSKRAMIDRFLREHKDWTRKVYLVSKNSTSGPQPSSPKQIIEEVFRGAGLARGGENMAALMTFWACLEATARQRYSEKFERPQSPGRVVEQLAALGEILPSDADFLREMANFRNSYIHGDFSIGVSLMDLSRFHKILRTLHPEIRDSDLVRV